VVLISARGATADAHENESRHTLGHVKDLLHTHGQVRSHTPTSCSSEGQEEGHRGEVHRGEGHGTLT